ncbi:membrane protein [gut metagenome]|uniref:Membrane protein n=1 Tax=gut metagenome TaxID=749906 RepID=J9CP39_9ZZZZ
MYVCRCRVKKNDELALFVSISMNFVSIVEFTTLLGPTCISVFLTSLKRIVSPKFISSLAIFLNLAVLLRVYCAVWALRQRSRLKCERNHRPNLHRSILQHAYAPGFGIGRHW